jgi:uncharacterized membrane protein
MEDNPHSTASIAGHPIHPMLIPFPIAFFVGTFVSDLIFWGSGDPFWSHLSFVLLSGGLIMAAFAALAGLTDFLGDRRIRALPVAWRHMIGNVIAVLVSLASWLVRLGRQAEGVLPTGLILSAIVVCILLYTGWRGWEMVYRGRVGVSSDDANATPAGAQTGFTRPAR